MVIVEILNPGWSQNGAWRWQFSVDLAAIKPSKWYMDIDFGIAIQDVDWWGWEDARDPLRISSTTENQNLQGHHS